MIGNIILGVLAVFLIAMVIYGISAYNKLVSERLKVDNQWSQIDIVLKQRSDTIPNLIHIVSGYAAHEKELLQSVTQARSRYLGTVKPEEAVQAANALASAMQRLFAVAEGYPELKANTGFLSLQNQYAAMEEKIADFRQFYNDTVMRYNRLILTFPSSIIASLFHFRERAFFNAEEKDRTAPQVHF